MYRQLAESMAGLPPGSDPILDVAGTAFHLVELAPGVTLAEVVAKTGARSPEKKGASITDWFISADTNDWYSGRHDRHRCLEPPRPT